MDVMTLQILLFFIFPAIIHSKNPCPNSTCGNNYFTINYPFKLQTDHQQKDCPDIIDLRCDEQGHVVVNLPSCGDFYVTSINYVLQRIYLNDPGNCLLGRLMGANISAFPLLAYFYENYTYYVCPKEHIAPPFSEIQCLSNSTSATIATIFSSEYMKDEYGCQKIASSLIPVSWSSQFNLSGNFGHLELTWNVSGCTECEEYVPQNPGNSKSNMAKFFGSPLFIPAAVVLLTFLGIASLLRIMKLIAGRATTAATAAMEFSAATRATGDFAEESQVKSFSEVVGLSESEGTLVCCSICLEEYNGEDVVRNMSTCGHYFHANCIDQWLQNNTTCPVCRTSLP